MALIDGYREFTGGDQTDRYDEFADKIDVVDRLSDRRCPVRSPRYQCSGRIGHSGRQHATMFASKPDRVHSVWFVVPE